MIFAIFSRQLNSERTKSLFQELLLFLKAEGQTILVHENIYSEVKDKDGVKVFTTLDGKKKINFLLSLGGDGTILETLSIVKDSGIPVLGINMGRLGFLASTAQEDYQVAIGKLLKGKYSISSRTILQLESSEKIFDYNMGLNDFVIHKTETSSMITVKTYLNGEFLNSYWADGLIIATPTGSSGYSLSCGGPILFPGSSSFAITPIAPHNLNVRPIVISDENVLSFKVEGRSHRFLTSIDSRSVSITPNVEIAIKKANFYFNLIRLDGQNFHTTLRNKLMWGVDRRNP
jgi:NAD+ kinase